MENDNAKEQNHNPNTFTTDGENAVSGSSKSGQAVTPQEKIQQGLGQLADTFKDKIKLPNMPGKAAGKTETQSEQVQQPPQEPVQPQAQVAVQPEAQTVTSSKAGKPKLPAGLLKKVVIIAVVVIVLLFVLMIVMSFLRTGNVNPLVEPTPTASASASPGPVIGRPSPYANDPEIAELEEQLKELEQLMNSATFREDTLRVPALDWEIDFGDN